MKVTLEPMITLPLSQYNDLKEKSHAVDTKAGVIKQAIMTQYMSEFYEYHHPYGKPMEDLYRKKASAFADEILKRLRMW